MPTTDTAIDTYAEAALQPADELPGPGWVAQRYAAGAVITDGYVFADTTPSGFLLTVTAPNGLVRTEAAFGDDELGRRLFVAAVAEVLAS